jgi:hypothetical protein
MIPAAHTIQYNTEWQKKGKSFGVEQLVARE